VLGECRCGCAEFEGPLPLLLHLIERNELEITKGLGGGGRDQFPGAGGLGGHADLAATGEFVAAAARLLLIKSVHCCAYRWPRKGRGRGRRRGRFGTPDRGVPALSGGGAGIGSAAAAGRADVVTPPGPAGMVGPRTLPAISPETLGRAALRLLKAEALGPPATDWPLWSWRASSGTAVATAAAA